MMPEQKQVEQAEPEKKPDKDGYLDLTGEPEDSKDKVVEENLGITNTDFLGLDSIDMDAGFKFFGF